MFEKHVRDSWAIYGLSSGEDMAAFQKIMENRESDRPAYVFTINNACDLIEAMADAVEYYQNDDGTWDQDALEKTVIIFDPPNILKEDS
jgi:hypothetical protein